MLTVSSSDGQTISLDKATWQSAEQSDSCQDINNPLVCGYEVAGNRTLEISTEGFQPQTLVAQISQGECHVVSQKRNVVLKPSAHLPSLRHFVHRYFPTERACQKTQTGKTVDKMRRIECGFPRLKPVAHSVYAGST